MKPYNLAMLAISAGLVIIAGNLVQNAYLTLFGLGLVLLNYAPGYLKR